MAHIKYKNHPQDLVGDFYMQRRLLFQTAIFLFYNIIESTAEILLQGEKWIQNLL